MAIVKNDPFPGTDYTQFSTWKKVVTPAGQVFYVVPGNEAYVYDPVASNASGRKVFRANPTAAIAKDQEAEDLKKKQINQQLQNSSPLGQALPVAYGAGGIILANQFTPAAAKTATQQILEQQAAQQLEKQAAQKLIEQQAAQQVTQTGAQEIAPVVTEQAIGSEAAPVAAETAGSIGANAAELGVGPLAAIAGATYLGGKSAYDMLKGKNDKSTLGMVGRGTLGIATGGLSEIARPFFMKPSTRDIAKGHTSDLLNVGTDDANYQNYVKGMREQYNSAPVDPSKPFAGKYNSWEEYQKGCRSDRRIRQY